MLSRVNRIKKKKDFETIFKGAKSFKNSLFVLKTIKNNLGLNRFGFVVSQKVSKKATIRNKVRRRLSEAAGARINMIKTGTDIVLIALPNIEKKEFCEIKEALSSAIKKTKLTKED